MSKKKLMELQFQEATDIKTKYIKVISLNTPLFVAIELVSLSASGSGSRLTGLGTQSGTKKKAKPEVTGGVVDLSAGPLSAALLHLDDEEHKIFWGSKVENDESSVSGVSDVENIVNTIVEETSYAESGEDNKINEATPKKTRTHTYMLDKSPKAPMFDSMSDDKNVLNLPSPKMFNGSSQMLSVKSRIIEKRSFEPVKSFALDVELSAAREMAVHKKIVVNGDFKKANICSNWEVVVKEIPVNLPKLAVKSVFSKFGKIQKALIEFKSSESVLVEKDSVYVVLAVNDKQMWVSRNYYWALLYTLPVGTLAHDLSELLVSYGEKTCFIGCNPGLYVHDQYAIICFENEDARLATVSTVSIFKGVRLHWANLVLAKCTKCEQFGHTTTNCLVGRSSGVHGKRVVFDQDRVCLAGIYKKKLAPIARPFLFGDKTWAQVASGTSSHVPLSGSPGSGLCSGLAFPLAVSDHLVVSYLSDCLAVLECSLELLADCVSGILVRLDSFGVVPLVPSSLAPSPVVSAALSSKVDSDMIVDNALSSSDITPPITIDAVVDLSASSFKVLTAKMGSLEMKLVALEASVGSIVMCNVKDMNNCAKQADIVHWHKNMNNMISIVTETKLKGKIRPCITNKFDSVCVFTFGLDSGHMRSGVAIILDSSLVRHVCKVSEVSGRLLLVKLLFRNKLSVSILGLYAGVSSAVCFSQAGKVNSLIAKAVNESSFVIFGGDFNEDGSYKCASFKKCFDLGLINSLRGSSFVKLPTWCNSCGVTKTIDYVLIFSNLVGVVVDHGVNGVEDYFDTNYKAVSVSVGLGGLLNVKLNSLHKQANRDCWKYNIKNANEGKWSEFRDAMAANAAMFSDEFVAAKWFSDLDAMWNIVYKIIVLSTGRTFKKKWFKGFDCVFNKVFSQFHKLELLVSKLVKASCFNAICSGLAKARKSYRSSKLLESKHANESHMRQAIERRMESFEVDKDHTIRSVLERFFHKVVLNHLVDDRELVLEPELVRSKVDGIMEGWTKKHVVASDISNDWVRQFQLLDYVFNDVFSNVMYLIGFNKMFGVISNLPDGKLVLDMLLVLLNFCLDCELVLRPWRETWGILTNTRSIALIETACKVLFKIFSDWISLAYSTFDVLCGDNFFVLKSMSTQLPIFAVGSVIKNALEKNQELWLVLQDMRKAYDSVGWEHLKRSLIRIKICGKFIRFFGCIHNGRTNRIITDFGLTDRYHVHDRLDQVKVFLPLLWCIFYDPLLREVKRQESICGYRLISHFVSKTGRMESQAGLISFLAAGAFVDNTIWVGSSQAATQYIFNVASNFFRLNDISINNNKTVVIPINCQITAPYLTINGLPISITRRSEPHHYLGIFLSSEGLLKSSLVKAHLDVQFFTNLVLRKVVLDKQFAYLVSSVLFPIVSYRTQFSYIPLNMCNKWDALICKGLKSKFGLSLDFPNDALHHFSLYNLKTFEQIQAKSKSASVIAFANSFGVLGHLFSHKSHNLQVLSWRPHHFLLFLVCVRVSLSNNFLAGVVHIFSGCNLSLSGFLDSAFCLWSDTSMSLVLGKAVFYKCVFSFMRYGIAFVEQLCDQNGVVFDWKTFKRWKKLDPCGLISFWFDLSVHFLGGVASPSGHSPYESVCGSSDIHQSLGFGVICNNLLNVDAARLSVYTDESLNNLGTVNMLAGAAVFFEDIDSGLGVGVSGLVSSTLAELQAIALALECVPSFYLIDLFLDSQAAIDACRSESLLVDPDFRNHCWIECCHITNVIHCKNLDVNWIKIKSHLGVSGNEHADALAKNTALSRFLKAGVDTVSSNSRHFVRCLCADIDWLRFFLVWHPDFYMGTGFTSIRMAGFRTYFMKALHHRLLVVVQKRLYDKSYPSVVCLFCGEIKVSDHVFSCFSDTNNYTNLLDTYAAAWKMHSGLSRSSSCILQLLSTCISDVTVSMTMCKGFVFGDWYHKSVSVYKDPKVAVVNVVNFVHEFCLVFYDNIWLVYVKHQAIMEKNKLIPHDGSIPVAVTGFSMQLSAEVIRLLGVVDVLSISFRYRKCCLFYADISDMASVHISA
ncbi:hypothetical protein G9A89_005362 [Geosiphon pyriformis]|nr:hypothetical protein G9A89_005362 [Geosiphon pyriformis]